MLTESGKREIEYVLSGAASKPVLESSGANFFKTASETVISLASLVTEGLALVAGFLPFDFELDVVELGLPFDPDKVVEPFLVVALDRVDELELLILFALELDDELSQERVLEEGGESEGVEGLGRLVLVLVLAALVLLVVVVVVFVSVALILVVFEEEVGVLDFFSVFGEGDFVLSLTLDLSVLVLGFGEDVGEDLATSFLSEESIDFMWFAK